MQMSTPAEIRPTVIPAKAGIQLFLQARKSKLDPGLRRDDGDEMSRGS
jgi:hypothetical protein